MKTNREPIFPYQSGHPREWRGRYQRMAPAERPLMTWYLEHPTCPALELWYDVRIDGITDSAPDTNLDLFTDDPDMRRMWWAQTAKRCDAIERRQGDFRIIEVRYHVAPQTLGELQLYHLLATAQWPDLTFAPPLLLCALIDDAIALALARANYSLLVAPDVPLDQPRDA